MIRFHLDAIEQLDVALEHLERNDKNATRFALSLIDNVVELTLVKISTRYKWENELYTQYGMEPVHSTQSVSKALSMYFPEKLKGLEELKAITSTQAQILRNLHSFRNDSYHNGKTLERVLHAITVYYLSQACELALIYKSNVTCLNDWLEIPFRTRRYLNEFEYLDGNISQIDSRILFSAYKTVSSIAASLKTDIVKSLTEDLTSEISDLESSIELISDNCSISFKPDDIFTYLNTPVHTFTFNAENYLFIAKRGDGYGDFLMNKYNLKQKNNPINSWRSKVDEIKKMEPPKALNAYCKFLEKNSIFSTTKAAADRHAEDVEDWVQLEIDILRGK